MDASHLICFEIKHIQNRYYMSSVVFISCLCLLIWGDTVRTACVSAIAALQADLFVLSPTEWAKQQDYMERGFLWWAFCRINTALLFLSLQEEQDPDSEFLVSFPFYWEILKLWQFIMNNLHNAKSVNYIMESSGEGLYNCVEWAEREKGNKREDRKADLGAKTKSHQ